MAPGARSLLFNSFHRFRKPPIGLLRLASSDGTFGPPTRKIHYPNIIVNNLIENFVVKRAATHAGSGRRRALPDERRFGRLRSHGQVTRREARYRRDGGTVALRTSVSFFDRDAGIRGGAFSRTEHLTLYNQPRSRAADRMWHHTRHGGSLSCFSDHGTGSRRRSNTAIFECPIAPCTRARVPHSPRPTSRHRGLGLNIGPRSITTCNIPFVT